MSERWRIEFYVWPYSGVSRGDNLLYLSEDERRSRGHRAPVVKIYADNFKEAHRKATDMLDGIKLDERVWECGITSIGPDRREVSRD